MKSYYIYGESFTGKSFLAKSFPKPFFINTDGNAKYLDVDYVHVKNANELAKALQDYDPTKYSTLVIDRVDEIYDLIAENIFERDGKEFAFDYKRIGEGWMKPRKAFSDMLALLEAKLPEHHEVVFIALEQFSDVIDPSTGATIRNFVPTLDKASSKELMSKSFVTFRTLKRKNMQNQIEYVLSFGSGSETSGSRVPLIATLIPSSYENLKKNLGESIDADRT